MKKTIFLWTLAITNLFMHKLLANNGSLLGPVIHSVEVLTPNVELFGKFEAKIDLSASYSNPYNYSQIEVSATFTSPSGATKTVDGFFMQDYSLNESNGNLSIDGTGHFRIRFSPTETGTWSFIVSLIDGTGSTSSEPTNFGCLDLTNPLNHGFIRKGATNYLQFDDGNQYIAIGENMAWQNNNAYLNYKSWLEKLIENGGNFFRLWHAHWGLGIEWSPGNGFQGLMNYKQTNCYYQDWMFDYCAENGVYIMLALQHHGPVSTQVNPNWNESPYNAANGGPCLSTLDFFTNEDARSITKNRYRYILARWGYSRSILCWELFNEVHWTDNFQVNKADVANWHFEMADYLKNIDPNQHLVTTSYGDDLSDEEVWAYPAIDITQTHTYINVANIERALANENGLYLNEFGKPTLNGEFGLGGTASLANQDPDGIHIHNALWGSLFGGGLGTAMTWWWDNYIHPQDLYHHFYGISQLVNEIPFLDQNLSPAGALVVGAPDDLTLNPSLGWGSIGTSEITITETGLVLPPGAVLSQFLYGSQWNTQFRSPPSFLVNYPVSGDFVVTTGAETGTAPKITIKLDGATLIDQTALTNTSYTITVPAGNHTIMVDNTGTDWILISSYRFEGLGSQIDAHVLVAETKEMVTGWALNNRYNHQHIADFGEPDPTPPATILVEGMQNGTYSLRWYDSGTGALGGNDVAVALDGTLNIPLGSFLWDRIFIVDNPVVGTQDVQPDIALNLFPNPVKPGGTVHFKPKDENTTFERITLLDPMGRVIFVITAGNDEIHIPAEVPNGPYWLKFENRDGFAIEPIVVIE